MLHQQQQQQQSSSLTSEFPIRNTWRIKEERPWFSFAKHVHNFTEWGRGIQTQLSILPTYEGITRVLKSMHNTFSLQVFPRALQLKDNRSMGHGSKTCPWRNECNKAAAVKCAARRRRIRLGKLHFVEQISIWGKKKKKTACQGLGT